MRARINFDDSMKADDLGSGSSMYRIGQDAVEFEPELYRMSQDEVDTKAREKERDTRRLRRTQRAGMQHSFVASPTDSRKTRASSSSNVDDWQSTFKPSLEYNQATQKTIAYQFYKGESDFSNHLQLADTLEAKRNLIAKNKIPSLITGSRRRTSVGVSELDLIEQLDLMIENTTASAANPEFNFDPAGDDDATPSLRRTSDMSSTSTGSSGSQGPRVHRGFGASAGQFNKGQLVKLINRWQNTSWKFQIKLAMCLVSNWW